MKPKVIHQQAMDLSFKAKQSLEDNKYGVAFELFKEAAELESQVAEFYFDKPELEPTRSIIIRSAAFLNLKAGYIDNAQRFIFFGLLNIVDEQIRNQLNDALELAVSLRNLNPERASNEFNYLNLLRQRSVQYSLEPTDPAFGRSVSLEMLRDFTESYLKSLKAYAISKYKRIEKITDEIESSVIRGLEKIVNPLITQSSYGSFKFSIANDYLTRTGEPEKLVEFKANIVPKYHNEIFINPLTDEGIEIIKGNYSENEINDIFRPLFKIKSNNTPYKIGYIDSENLYKNYVGRIVNKQKKQLITIKQLSEEDIGELESSIIHKRSLGGKITKETILKEHLKSYSHEFVTRQIEPKNKPPLIFNDDIIISVNFNSDSGFAFAFEDMQIEYLDTEFHRGLTGFYMIFYERVIYLINKNEKERSEKEHKDYEVISRLIGNPDALKI
jgi:hypothetical protein